MCYEVGVDDSENGSAGAPAKAVSESASSADGDVALICGPTSDNKGLSVIRRRGERVELGSVRPLKDGEPLHGEIVRLKPRRDQPLICDVEVQWSPSEAARREPGVGQSDAALAARPGRGRPPQVATDTYRSNWDTIWQSNRSARAALN